MIDAYVFYQDVLDVVNKHENGYVPDSLFSRKGNNVSLRRFKNLIKFLQDPANGDKERQATKDLLSPFIKTVVIPVEDGIAAKPEDFEFYDAAMCVYDNGEAAIKLANLYAQLCDAETDPTIDLVKLNSQIAKLANSDNYTEAQIMGADRIGRRLRSFIPGKRPSKAKPVVEQLAEGFKVYPIDAGSLRLSYYRLPANGKLVMTADNTGELQYDLSASTAWEWTNSSRSELVNDLAQDIAVFLRDRDLFQMSEIKQPKP